MFNRVIALKEDQLHRVTTSGAGPHLQTSTLYLAHLRLNLHQVPNHGECLLQSSPDPGTRASPSIRHLTTFTKMSGKILRWCLIQEINPATGSLIITVHK
ncbi:hypothetical protein AVEN_68094-1 [Araneus ventricosus]|uniref:Uncharacterized protein n=1 Tax=Araneus ventricosus TaxID=182803 RepID=A0A4Y2USL6_ARAVE|nr:hypothetical protein AVEN_68094-1 [Araneus ventricosus]